MRVQGQPPLVLSHLAISHLSEGIEQEVRIVVRLLNELGHQGREGLVCQCAVLLNEGRVKVADFFLLRSQQARVAKT